MTNILASSEGVSHEEALLSQNDHTACLGRIAVSEASEKLVELINDELQRGTPISTLLISMARFQLQMHASIAAQTIGPKGIRAVAGIYKDMLEGDYIKHAERVRYESGLQGEPA